MIRQTSSIAAYWHRQHPAPALSPDDLADRVRLRDHEADRLEREEETEYERYVIQNRWGGRVPNARLRAASETSNLVDQLDRNLVFALSEVDDETQMAVAVWAAERACEVAGLARRPAFAAMLAAVRSGDNLPAPFDNHQLVWDLLDSDDMDMSTIGLPLVLGTGTTNISQKHVAVPALLAAASQRSDSLAAALDALWAAAGAHGEPGYRGFLAQLRNEFPELRT